MAITTNTRRTLEKESTALAPKCEATQKNMDKLLKDAGCKMTVKKVRIPLPVVPGDKSDVIMAQINGAKFYFQRGKAVYVPEPVMQLWVDCGKFPAEYMDMYKTTAKE